MKMTRSTMALFLCSVVSNSFAGATDTIFECEGSDGFVVEKDILKCDLRGKITTSSTLKIPFVKEIILKSNINTKVTEQVFLDLLQQGKTKDELIAQLPRQRFKGTIVLHADNGKLPFSLSAAPTYTLTPLNICHPDLKIKVALNVEDLVIKGVASMINRTVQHFLNNSSEVKKQVQKLTLDSLSNIQKFLKCQE